KGKRPCTVRLCCARDLRFRGRAGSAAVVVDSDGLAGASPVQSLALALAGCMCVAVVQILQKGGLPLRGMRAPLRGERAASEPHRLVRVDLRFDVAGDIAP